MEQITNYIHSIYLRFKIDPQKKSVYIYNIWGQYNDNTKALVEAYYDLYPENTYYYEVKNREIANKLPIYLTPVLKGSEEALKAQYASSVVVDNDWGTIKCSSNSFGGMIKCFLLKFLKSKNALYISLGHGTPLKKIGNDVSVVGNDYKYYTTSTDVMFVTDNHLMSVMKRITLDKIPKYILSSSPRNDKLLENDRKILNGKKMILFAPTFRTKLVNGKQSFEGAEKFFRIILDKEKQILDQLNATYGGDWIIGIRIHPGAMALVNSYESNNIFNANLFDDMADCMSAAEILVTDYSSCCFDFMITGRPCFLFWFDEKDYDENQRGLYFNREELPFMVSNTIDNLIIDFSRFDTKCYKHDIKAFKEKIGFISEANASYEIVKKIEMLRKEKGESS